MSSSKHRVPPVQQLHVTFYTAPKMIDLRPPLPDRAVQLPLAFEI